MIEKHPDVPYNIFALDPHETFSDYARAYGDEIARRYEHNDIIYFPRFPLPVDLAFIQALLLPESVSKIGITNGIEAGVYIRDGVDFRFDRNHVLYKIFRSENLAGYLQQQIRNCNDEIRTAVRILFPKYLSLVCPNITWRLTDTPKSPMHIDHFNQGKAAGEILGSYHKVKLFINIDLEPRHWRTSYTLPDILARFRDKLPQTLPKDRNELAWLLADMDVLKDAPGHALAFPPMSAIAVNGDTVAHQVLSGKRMVAPEFVCEQGDMIDPGLQAQACLPRWLSESGYSST